MIWKQWTEECLPQCSTRSKWFKSERLKLKVGDTACIVRGLFRRILFPIARDLGVQPRYEGVVTSAGIKVEIRDQLRSLDKLATVFHHCFAIENMAHNVGATTKVSIEATDF